MLAVGIVKGWAGAGGSIQLVHNWRKSHAEAERTSKLMNY